mmetsp:Transcript_45846/g.141964  ORF Transcript_45846/g.141964 Transcript_45846/m.141964 type:complete len:439 (-) Transcript_45846:416-1732(-)
MARNTELSPQGGHRHNADPVGTVEDDGTDPQQHQVLDAAAQLSDLEHHEHAQQLQDPQDRAGPRGTQPVELPREGEDGEGAQQWHADDEPRGHLGYAVLLLDNEEGPGLPAHLLEAPDHVLHTHQRHEQPRGPHLDRGPGFLVLRRLGESGVRHAGHGEALTLRGEPHQDASAVGHREGDHQRGRRDPLRDARQTDLAQGRERGATYQPNATPEIEHRDPRRRVHTRGQVDDAGVHHDDRAPLDAGQHPGEDQPRDGPITVTHSGDGVSGVAEHRHDHHEQQGVLERAPRQVDDERKAGHRAQPVAADRQAAEHHATPRIEHDGCAPRHHDREVDFHNEVPDVEEEQHHPWTREFKPLGVPALQRAAVGEPPQHATSLRCAPREDEPCGRRPCEEQLQHRERRDQHDDEHEAALGARAEPAPQGPPLTGPKTGPLAAD